MGDFFAFRKMITPSIIKVLFWALSILVVLAGVAAMLSPMREGPGVIGGLLIIVLGPIFVRMWCEFVILWFRVHEALVDIRANTARPEPAGPAEA